jgi:short chain dehydrogenase
MLLSLLRYAEIQAILASGSSILLLILSAYSFLVPPLIWSWVSSSYVHVLLYCISNVVLVRWLARGGQYSEIHTVDLEGQTFLITGAGGGIGKETAKELAKRGARVVLFARPRNLAEAIGDVKRVARSANNVVGYPIDLSDLRSIKSCAEELLKTENE